MSAIKEFFILLTGSSVGMTIGYFLCRAIEWAGEHHIFGHIA